MREWVSALGTFLGSVTAGIRGAIGTRDLPPHEYAYGAVLPDSAALVAAVGDFLSLSILDASQTRIEVSSLSSGDIGLDGFGRIVDELAQREPALVALASTVRKLATKPATVEAAVSLVSALASHREHLRDESRQEDIIVFLHYAVKRPAALEERVARELIDVVQKFDEPRRAELLRSGKAPDSFFAGNINIYPFAVDNGSWREVVRFEAGDPGGPIFEVRFMGLRGIARCLFTEFQRRTSLRLVHLDGEVMF